MLRRKSQLAAIGSLVLALVSSPGLRSDEWFDDFGDGDVFDGKPLTWLTRCDLPGEYDATTGDLVLRNVRGDVGSVFLSNDIKFTGDVSIRVRGRPVGPGGLWVFVHPRCGRGYLAGFGSDDVNDVDRVVLFQRYDDGFPATIDERAPIEVPVDEEEDYLFQFDVIGNVLELRAWPEGDEMPEEPQFSLEDVLYREGRVGLGYTPLVPGASAVFRYVWISDTKITDTKPPFATRFLRGDCSGDGTVDISDATCTLNWLFLAGAPPDCIAVTNTNGDARADISDATYLLNHLFLGGPAPVAPYPECGIGKLPTDEETCETEPKACQQ